MDDRFLSTTWKETVIKEEEISKKTQIIIQNLSIKLLNLFTISIAPN